jgi:hypothetical protein
MEFATNIREKNRNRLGIMSCLLEDLGRISDGSTSGLFEVLVDGHFANTNIPHFLQKLIVALAFAKSSLACLLPLQQFIKFK